MTWDEERMIKALEAKGRTICANIVRRIASGTEARRAETENTGSVHDGPTREAGDAQKGSAREVENDHQPHP